MSQRDSYRMRKLHNYIFGEIFGNNKKKRKGPLGLGMFTAVFLSFSDFFNPVGNEGYSCDTALGI